MTTANTIAQVIAGEAVSGTPQQRYEDMKAIASVIANRAALLGVSMDDVVAAPNQFDAYGKPMPPGTASLVGLAQQALDDVQQNGVVTNATYYATPAAVSNLPSNLQPETSTAGHQYFSDPEMRGIKTAIGTMTPDPSRLAQVANPSIPTPEARPAVNSFSDLANAGAPPSFPDLQQNGLLSSMFSSDPAASPISAPSVNASATGLLGQAPDLSASAAASPMANSGWQTMANAGPMISGAPFSTDSAPSGSTDVGSGTGTPADVATRMGLPERNDFATMATYGHISSPLGVTAALGNMGQPDLSAQASVPAGILSQQPQTPSLNNFAALAAAGPISSPMNSVMASAPATATSPAMAANAGLGVSVAPSDNNQFASRFAPTIDPATNTQSFMDMPQTPAQTATANIASATPTSTSGLLSGYQATPTSTPAENAISGLLSGPSATTIGNMAMLNQAMNPSVPSLNVPSMPSMPSDLGISTPGYQSLVSQSFPATAPSIDATASLPSIQGPASIPATTQQTDISPVGIGTTTAPQAQKSGFFNKGTIIGGLLGGAVAGPVGGILGGLVGNKVNQGGLTGLLGGSHPMSINPVTGSLANIAGIYGGSMPVGTQTTASNGSLITGMPGGWTSVVNPYGVTESVSPWGGYAADWSGMFSGNNGGPSNNGQPGGGGAIGGSGLF